MQSEGVKIKLTNESEGQKIRITNEAEADKIRVLLEAEAQAESILLVADAQARSVKLLAQALMRSRRRSKILISLKLCRIRCRPTSHGGRDNLFLTLMISKSGIWCRLRDGYLKKNWMTFLSN